MRFVHTRDGGDPRQDVGVPAQPDPGRMNRDRVQTGGEFVVSELEFEQEKQREHVTRMSPYTEDGNRVSLPESVRKVWRDA